MLKSIKPDQHNKIVCKLQKTETCKQWEVKITGRAKFARGKLSNKSLLFFIGIICTIRRWKNIASYILKESLYIVIDP